MCREMCPLIILSRKILSVLTVRNVSRTGRTYTTMTLLSYPIRMRKICPAHRLAQMSGFSSKSMKVAVLGAANRTGTCLSLFLKQASLIDELAIYDNKCTQGIALDLSHIDSKCKVSACGSSEKCLRQTLQDAKVVMIVAESNSDKTSAQRGTLTTSAEILSEYLPRIIRYCPRAMTAIAMCPINSLIPFATEMYKKAGIYDNNRLFGVTTLDSVRANTFVADVIGAQPECVTVPVIGGDCSATRVPLFSHTKPCNKLTAQEISRLTYAVRMSDEEVFKANKGREVSPIATAFAASRFCVSLCKALRHQSGVVECAYVRSCVIPEVTYFAAPLELGPDGIQKHLGVPPLTDYECKLLARAIPTLRQAIKDGETLALGRKATSSEICPQPIEICHQTLVPTYTEQYRP